MDQPPRNPPDDADDGAPVVPRGEAFAAGPARAAGSVAADPGRRDGEGELPPPPDDTPASPEVPVARELEPDDRPVPAAPAWAVVLLCGLVVLVPALAVLVSAEAATWVLAGSVTLVALLRVLTPAGGLFVARTRMADVILLLLLAATLSALAPWAATVDVGG